MPSAHRHLCVHIPSLLATVGDHEVWELHLAKELNPFQESSNIVVRRVSTLCNGLLELIPSLGFDYGVAGTELLCFGLAFKAAEFSLSPGCN